MLALLWDLVVHPSTQVRLVLVKMFDHLVSISMHPSSIDPIHIAYYRTSWSVLLHGEGSGGKANLAGPRHSWE